MDRFGLLQQLQDNWPSRVDMSRIQFYERKLRGFDEGTIAAGVETILETCNHPPTLRELRLACIGAQAREERRARHAKQSFRPGDPVDGRESFTPSEAVVEIERIRVEFPDAFEPSPAFTKLDTPEARRASLKNVVTRMYVSALRRCAKLDPNKPIVAPVQHDLF